MEATSTANIKPAEAEWTRRGWAEWAPLPHLLSPVACSPQPKDPPPSITDFGTPTPAGPKFTKEPPLSYQAPGYLHDCANPGQWDPLAGLQSHVEFLVHIDLK